MDTQFFTIDKKNVFYENFTDENVVVNIAKGNYYSMKGSAIEIWQLLENEMSISQLCIATVAIFDIDIAVAEKEINQFLNTLKEEQLVIFSNTQKNVVHKFSVTEKKQFSKPYLDIYSDLQELLLLDPIHEVDEVQGWPKAKN